MRVQLNAAFFVALSPNDAAENLLEAEGFEHEILWNTLFQ
jgi:hypothetical protein